jgi:hypothetical protein
MKHSKYKLIIALLMSLIITNDMTCAQDKKGSQQEQRAFFSDDPDKVYIRKPITLPDAAIQALRNSETGSKCLEQQRKFDAAWVVGSEVHLNGAGETAIVVMPKFFLKPPLDNSCMLGARTTTFWVLRKGNKGYQLLLETRASELLVDNSRHSGYLDIITYIVNFSDTDAVYYRFDGRRYQEFERKVGDKR